MHQKAGAILRNLIEFFEMLRYENMKKSVTFLSKVFNLAPDFWISVYFKFKKITPSVPHTIHFHMKIENLEQATEKLY